MIVLLLSFLIVMKRVDFKVEKWAITIQVFYIISASVSFVSWVIYLANGQPTSITMRDPYDCVQDVAELIVYTSLYFFIFECKDFYNKIRCDTAIEYQEELRKLKGVRFVMIALHIGFSLINIAITFYFAITNYDDETLIASKDALLQASLILYFVVLTLDLGMVIQFLDLAIFFIRAKLKKYKVLR